MLLLLTACGLAVTLALTARRTAVAPTALAIGAGTGLALGVVMYAVAPLGLNPNYPDRPWLHGSAFNPFVPLAWILLVGAPLVAGAIAGRRCYVSGTPARLAADRGWQGFAAGLVSGGVGALFVTVLGTGTTALLVKSAWARGLLYHGQHLTASAVYGRAALRDPGRGRLRLALHCLSGHRGCAGRGRRRVCQRDRPAARRRPSAPPPGPEPLPDPPDGGRRADAGADQDRLPGRYNDGEGGQGPPSLVGAGTGALRGG